MLRAENLLRSRIDGIMWIAIQFVVRRRRHLAEDVRQKNAFSGKTELTAECTEYAELERGFETAAWPCGGTLIGQHSLHRRRAEGAMPQLGEIQTKQDHLRSLR